MPSAIERERRKQKFSCIYEYVEFLLQHAVAHVMHANQMGNKKKKETERKKEKIPRPPPVQRELAGRMN